MEKTLFCLLLMAGFLADFIYGMNNGSNGETCTNVPGNSRFDCYPDRNATEPGCKERGCCWDETNTGPEPRCFFPTNYSIYRFVTSAGSDHGLRVMYEKTRSSGYPGDFEHVTMEVNFLSDDALQIKIFDADRERFDTPIPRIPSPAMTVSSPKYHFHVDNCSVGFKVIRISDNVTIVNTQEAGPMILSDKFLQISSLLPTDRVFGFGEHRAPFKRNMDWNTFTMFNRGSHPKDNTNLYGTQPLYLAVERNGQTHGMVLINSNAIDVALQPTPAMTYRAIGGVLNLVVFLGPTPEDVVSQYTGVVGRPFMPPYWSLGFQLCKFGYQNLNEVRHVWQTNRDAGIPFDVQWTDMDYMINNNDFTYDPVAFAGFPEFVDEVHQSGMHYMLMFDPGLRAAEKPGTYPPLDRGLEMDIFIKNSTNQLFLLKVWNPPTILVDFTHPNATPYWKEMMSNFHKVVSFDGAWIDMNEPTNYVDGQLNGTCGPEDLPYKPAYLHPKGLKYHTICMDAKHYIGQHYDVHNLYGLFEAVVTNSALTLVRGKRPFIISRASFPGLGHYAGHWSGDVSSTWDDMRMTIPDLLSFSLFGIPMSGSDICGFAGNTTAALCKRWMQLGAFYPFSRNHNDLTMDQDPVSLGPEVVAASIKALRMRYRLLPYYYMLFWRAHAFGETVARPLLFLAPDDLQLDDIDDQFLIGPHVMVAPILEEHAINKRAFFPAQRWYNLADGKFIASGQWFNVSEDETVSVKGGGILILQEPPMQGPVTTTNSRTRPFQLLVVPDNDDTATGEMFWDDGDSIDTFEEKQYSHVVFKLKGQQLSSNIKHWGYDAVPHLNNITVLEQNPVKSVTVPGYNTSVHFKYERSNRALVIFDLKLTLNESFTVKWSS